MKTDIQIAQEAQIDISTDGQTQREIENFRQHRRGNTHKTKRFSGLMHRLCQRL